ncbi:MAG: outer-membrane lipoprotein carrier protein LolA [Treponema sp.]|nr:outer-membrane lipoprotein carrier protein LolA [Treponema sp.]
MFNRKNRILHAALFFVLMICSSVSAQSITTASAYFKTVSEYYGTIKDYEADMDLSVSKQQMTAKVSFKRPDLLRLDFSDPADQVILFNGDMLTIYLPESSAVLQQSVQSDNGGAGGASLATPQGLSLMSRYYTVAYETGQDPVPLDDTSDEKVIKLILNRRNTAEAFRSIKLAINAETKLIRRVDAVTPRGDEFIFNFSNYKLNQNISDQRFIYDPPSSANNYNNFLLSN